ncbi:uncharacterized protein EI90DRAFT_3063779, partial [Cantharellus anzutake]|uniref:uncharacterized protein n=1 Tax=Cantharellus anzutake TaxID=1750568 RepID=UPI0019078930
MSSQPDGRPEKRRTFRFPDISYTQEIEQPQTPSSSSSCYSSYQVSNPSTLKRMKLLQSQYMHFHVENDEYVCEPPPSPESLARTQTIIELVEDAVQTCPDRIHQYLALSSTKLHSVYPGKTNDWGVIERLPPQNADNILPLAETEEQWDRWVQGIEKPPAVPKCLPFPRRTCTTSNPPRPKRATEAQHDSERPAGWSQTQPETQDFGSLSFGESFVQTSTPKNHPLTYNPNPRVADTQTEERTPTLKRRSSPSQTPLAKLPTLMSSWKLRAEKKRRRALARSSQLSFEYPTQSDQLPKTPDPEFCPASSLSTPPRSQSPLSPDPPRAVQDGDRPTSTKKKFSSFQPSQYEPQFDIENNVDEVLQFIDDD